MISKIKLWAKAMRLPFLTTDIVPVLLGFSLALYHGYHPYWMRFFLTLFAMWFLNLGTNLANDYYDAKSGNDELNKHPTPFSGGSRVIQEGLIKPSKILIVSIVFFALGSAIGLYLNYISKGNIILILGIIGVIFGFFYTAPPLKLAYRGIGEIIVALGFGPLPVLGAYYIQAGQLSIIPIIASIPIAILIYLVLFINEFPDLEPDRDAGKITFVVRLGKERAKNLYYALLISVYIFIILFVSVNIYPLIALFSFITVPILLKNFSVVKKHYKEINTLIPAQAGTINLHLFIGLVLSFSLIFTRAG